jgi:hypothetical protein
VAERWARLGVEAKEAMLAVGGFTMTLGSSGPDGKISVSFFVERLSRMYLSP